MKETREETRARLAPVLEQLRASGAPVFLDLCELVLMFAADVQGSVEWDHPRVVVKIRQRVAALKLAKRRGATLDPEQMP
jgi:hypothetical protein